MTEPRAAGKSCALVVLTLVSWFAVSLYSWMVFRPTLPGGSLAFHLLLGAVHLSWMIVWLWGLHNFWHQSLSLFCRRSSPVAHPAPQVPVAILYTTCDDFDPEACASALLQENVCSRLVICDDSVGESCRREIDEWVHRQEPRPTIIRRGDRRGFKAGNLNHAIATSVEEEFILICDADEWMPPLFAGRLLSRCVDSGAAFVQGNHRARSRPASWFAGVLGTGLELFFNYSLPLRNRFGFVCCLGHGVLIRRTVWSQVGGFPEIVAEDIGFAAKALVAGHRGVFAEDAVAEEAFPPTYKAFVVNRCRVVSGTIQFFQRQSRALLLSRASLTEKLDLLLTFTTCYAGLLIATGLLGGLVVSHLSSSAGYTQRGGWLLLLYLIGPLTPIIPLSVRALRQPVRSIRYVCTAATAYASIIPSTALRAFLSTLQLHRPAFEVTGKVARLQQGLGEHASTILSGSVLLLLALILHTPTRGATLAVAGMIALGPLLRFAEGRGFVGFVARNCPFLPYLALIWVAVAGA